MLPGSSTRQPASSPHFRILFPHTPWEYQFSHSQIERLFILLVCLVPCYNCQGAQKALEPSGPVLQVWAGCLTSAPGCAFPQEKEKLYMELKHVLARQPGPEAAEQLQIYQHTLREKTKQLKVSGDPALSC